MVMKKFRIFLIHFSDQFTLYSKLQKFSCISRFYGFLFLSREITVIPKKKEGKIATAMNERNLF